MNDVKEVAEAIVGLKRKAEETEPKETKKRWNGTGYYWTAEDDDALLEGAHKYGLDFKRIKKENGEVFAD